MSSLLKCYYNVITWKKSSNIEIWDPQTTSLLGPTSFGKELGFSLFCGKNGERFQS